MIKSFFNHLKDQFYNLGFFGFCFKVVRRIIIFPILKIIQVLFKYDAWHNTIYYDRPYAKIVVNHINQRNNTDSVIDIGCGTGDILRRLTSKEKYGADVDEKALNGLQFFSLFLNKSKMPKVFKHDFSRDNLEGQYDIIIMLNFAHLINSKLLFEKITRIYEVNLKPGGEILIDIVLKESKERNTISHDISILKIISSKVIKIGQQNDGLGRITYSLHKPLKSANN